MCVFALWKLNDLKFILGTEMQSYTMTFLFRNWLVHARENFQVGQKWKDKEAHINQ